VTEARLRMARVPQGASLIENPMSGAPGIKIGNIHILAGVPHIAAMMLDSLTGRLEGGRPVVSATIGSLAPESEVADMLAATERTHEGCQIGSYPFFRDGIVGANFVIRSTDEARLRACEEDLARQLLTLGYAPVAGGI
jgi:molybdopterin-biosynthesis enzyme MoeA-like protein